MKDDKDRWLDVWVGWVDKIKKELFRKRNQILS